MNPDIEQLADFDFWRQREPAYRNGRRLHPYERALRCNRNRMNRYGALIQTGARWTTRMSAWSEQIDRLLVQPRPFKFFSNKSKILLYSPAQLDGCRNP